LDSCRSLEAEGFEVTYLPVKTNGLIDMKQLEDAIRPDTSLVSIMTVNNEIGVCQPVHDIGECYSYTMCVKTVVDPARVFFRNAGPVGCVTGGPSVRKTSQPNT
jgi:cysteine sulfinate desulfinase/cysteine desulfurase-like protein